MRIATLRLWLAVTILVAAAGFSLAQEAPPLEPTVPVEEVQELPRTDVPAASKPTPPLEETGPSVVSTPAATPDETTTAPAAPRVSAPPKMVAEPRWQTRKGMEEAARRVLSQSKTVVRQPPSAPTPSRSWFSALVWGAISSWVKSFGPASEHYVDQRVKDALKEYEKKHLAQTAAPPAHTPTTETVVKDNHWPIVLPWLIVLTLGLLLLNRKVDLVKRLTAFHVEKQWRLINPDGTPGSPWQSHEIEGPLVQVWLRVLNTCRIPLPLRLRDTANNSAVADSITVYGGPGQDVEVTAGEIFGKGYPVIVSAGMYVHLRYLISLGAPAPPTPTPPAPASPTPPPPAPPTPPAPPAPPASPPAPPAPPEPEEEEEIPSPSLLDD